METLFSIESMRKLGNVAYSTKRSACSLEKMRIEDESGAEPSASRFPMIVLGKSSRYCSSIDSIFYIP